MLVPGTASTGTVLVVPRRPPTRLLAGLAGVVVGIGVSVALVLSGTLELPRVGTNDAPAFLEAYERSRRATFAMDAAFSRTMPDGRRLESAAFVAQRPPDTIRRQLGGLSGVVAGRRLNCSTPAGGAYTCGPTGPAPPFEEALARDLAIFRGYFENPVPVYEVREVGDGCFELSLVGAVVDPPYGERTRMCFDDATGAMRTLEVQRLGGAVDRLEAVSIRSVVVDEDFTTSEDTAYAPTVREAP